MRTRVSAALLIVICLAGLGPRAEPARAAEPLPELGEETGAGGLPALLPGVQGAVRYRTWSIDQGGDESTIDQIAFPIYFLASLRSDLEVSYLLTAASSGVSIDNGSESSLTGLTDGKLGLTYYLPDRRFAAGLGLRLPTGESKLDPEEEAVAQALNDRIFGFPVRRYGEGMDVEARGTFATPLGHGTSVGAGVAYLVKGTFPILAAADSSGVRDPDKESTYEPGNELALSGRLGFRALGGDWITNARLSLFGTDERDGEPELEEGTEIDLGGEYHREFLRGIAEVGAELVLKEETTIVGTEGVAPVRDVGGDILRFFGAFHGKLDRVSRLGGRMAFHHYAEIEAGTGDGTVFEVGPFYRRAFGGGVGIEAGYMFLVGNAEDGTVDLTGHDVSLAIGYSPGARLDAR